MLHWLGMRAHSQVLVVESRACEFTVHDWSVLQCQEALDLFLAPDLAPLLALSLAQVEDQPPLDRSRCIVHSNITLV